MGGRPTPAAVSMAVGGEGAARVLDERHQEQPEREGDPEQHQYIVVGQHQRLTLHGVGEELDGGTRRVAVDQPIEPMHLHVEKMLHRRACRVDVLDQPVPVEMETVVHCRHQQCQPDRTAEITRQIVEPRGVLQLVGRQRAQCD